MRQKAGFDYLKEHLLSFPSAGPEEQNPSSDTTSCRTFCSTRSIAGNLIPLSTTCVIPQYNAGGRQITGTERVMSDTVAAESEGESSSQLFSLEVFVFYAWKNLSRLWGRRNQPARLVPLVPLRTSGQVLFFLFLSLWDMRQEPPLLPPPC